MNEIMIVQTIRTSLSILKYEGVLKKKTGDVTIRNIRRTFID